MLLFIVSFLLVVCGSYFLALIAERNNFIKFFIYFLLFAFANVVVTFEILSLFSAIKEGSVLLINVLFFIPALCLWIKKGRPSCGFSPKPFLKRLWAAVCTDKYLMVLTLSLIFMTTVSLWLISFMPVVNPDAEAYHVLRSVLWVLNKKIFHPPVGDVRNLVMPINSEILYTWIILFVKKQIWFGIFSFCGYLLSIVSLWGIMGNIGIGFKRKLWCICIVSSFASVIVQVSSTETDIIISGLVLASIYLFWEGVRCCEKFPIFAAALSYALAVGTKTPAIMLIPAVGLWMTGISVYELKKKFYKPVLWFCAAFVIFFLIFAAYNYVLNFIDYGDIAGSKSFLAVHRNFSGIKAAASNFIKYMFLFFDCTGFALNNTLGNFVMGIRDSILVKLGLDGFTDGFFSTNSSNTNISLLEPLMGMGILGFLVYLPCLFAAFVKPVFSKCRRDILIFSFALILIFGLAVLSYYVPFMTFSVRFFASFCVIASPVLAYSYFEKNNFFKFVIVFFAVFYLVFLSTHLWARPALLISRLFKNGATIQQVREISVCSIFNNNISKSTAPYKNSPMINDMCVVRNEIKKYGKQKKILYFSNMSTGILVLALMNFQGYHIDFNIMENADNIDFSKYDVILSANDLQVSTNVINFDKRNKDSKFYTKGVICRYYNTKADIIPSDSKEYPFLSSCGFEEYFFRNNNFAFDRLFTIKRNTDNTNVTTDYRLYVNRNRKGTATQSN